MSVVLEDHIDPNYEPSQQEVEEYGKWLGMALPAEKDLLWIAREGLKAPLPENWKACKSEKGELYYFNFKSGQSIWDHPMDDHFKKRVAKAKEQRANPSPARRRLRKAMFAVWAVARMMGKMTMNHLRRHGNASLVHMLTTTGLGMTAVDLSGMCIGDAGEFPIVVALRRFVRRQTDIMAVNLSGNNIGDGVIKVLCGVVAQHPSITEIDLSNNPFTDVGVDALYKLVLNNQRLRKIKFEPYYPGCDPDEEDGLMPFTLKRIQNRLEERVAADLAARWSGRSRRRGG